MTWRFSPSASTSGTATPRDGVAATDTTEQSAKTSAAATRMIPSLSWRLVYWLDALGGVFLGDLVVEERGRVRRRHEAPVHLGVHAAVLEHLAVRHLDFERARRFFVADRAQL